MTPKNTTELKEMIQEMGLNYLRFSTTQDCNARCTFCHNEGQKFGARGKLAQPKPSFLSGDEINYIASFFSDVFREVKLTGGEPTLTSNLDEIAGIFASHNYRCSLTTNGVILDAQMQQRLKDTGVRKVNVSLSTLDRAQYELFNRIEGGLDRVLENLETLPKYFGESRINFMGSPQTVPSQVLPMAELSARTGITISCLELASTKTLSEPTSAKIISYLSDSLGINSTEEQAGRFGAKKIYTFGDGSRWEVDDFREKDYRTRAFDNDVCGSCQARDNCAEGPYALRVGYDGTLRLCLQNKELTFRFGEGGYESPETFQNTNLKRRLVIV